MTDRVFDTEEDDLALFSKSRRFAEVRIADIIMTSPIPLFSSWQARLGFPWFLPIAMVGLSVLGCDAWAQSYGPPDRGEPGDEMIQGYLRSETEKLESTFLPGGMTAEGWLKIRPQYLEEYFYMLGLWPMPERTPLQAKVTGQLAGDGYTVELLHYQSRPRLYVTANLYRPAQVKTGERLPAVLYVCGHSGRGRNGNKTAYQSQGMWFARHGYICLVLDTLQLGEISAIHHGTYREGRWWWWSRGYTPAGVECWNGVRGLDYLATRPDVDPERLAVTGISGGGATTFWIAAADERVKVAVPVSGMADLLSYVPNRVINGHCDCMFLYNTFEWPWTRIAALVAPRPLLFVNSDQDSIFPMDANERVINRLERLYSLFGAGDQVDSVVSVGGHAYRKDIRQAAFRFINMHLKDDPRLVGDSETDLVIESGNAPRHPLDPDKLRVFPRDEDLPKDELNTRIDEHFVPMANVPVPRQGAFGPWRQALLNELRRVTFRCFPARLPAARQLGWAGAGVERLETEPGIEIRLKKVGGPDLDSASQKVLVLVANREGIDRPPDWLKNKLSNDTVLYVCEPRGLGATRWTRKNPPNYVERSLALLGRTADAGRVWDVAATARYLQQKYGAKAVVKLSGENGAAILAAYAALVEPEVAGLVLYNPVPSLMHTSAPSLLNALRVCDVPEVLGMLAPRPLLILGNEVKIRPKLTEIYAAAGATDQLAFPDPD
jgi:dienelactone hydrolase